MDRFRSPGNTGEIENPDGLGSVGGGGLAIRITIRVDGDRITEARFLSSTCVVAVAACSLVTDLARGMTLKDAENLSWETVAAVLGGIPAEKWDHCMLAVEALHAAVQDHHNRLKKMKLEDKGL